MSPDHLVKTDQHCCVPRTPPRSTCQIRSDCLHPNRIHGREKSDAQDHVRSC
jgi:hypothetical protein